MKRLVMIALSLAASAAVVQAQAPDAKTLYDSNCKRCHGVRGTPPQTMKAKYPKIAVFDAEFVAKHSVDSIAKVLTKGKNEDMKSFSDKLSKDEIAAVAKYVHELAEKAKPAGN